MSAAKTTLICDSCGQAFGKKPSLIKHMKNKHPRGATFKMGDQEYPIIAGAQQGNFECPIYRSQLSGGSGLRRHVVKCSANCDADPRLESDSERSEAGDSDHYQEDGDYGETNTRENDSLRLEHLGFEADHQWRVAVCTRSRYADIDLVRRQIAAANLRPHLAILRNDHDHVDDDDNDKDDAGFLPGSAAVKGLPVYAGFKCLICLDRASRLQKPERVNLECRQALRCLGFQPTLTTLAATTWR
ncbi:hypothetical protein V1507DRAFT_500093 [Lipomyces tetrasporus]